MGGQTKIKIMSVKPLKKREPYILEGLLKELPNDAEIIWDYAKRWPDAIYKMKKDFFRSSRENMKKLLEIPFFSISLLEKEDYEDDEYMTLALINRPERIKYLYNRYHIDMLKRVIYKEMAIHLVRIQGAYLYFLDNFKDDEEVVLAAYEQDKNSIQYASLRLQHNLPDIIFNKKYDIDKVVLQSALNTVEKELITLRKLRKKDDLLRENIDLYLNQMDTSVENMEKVLSSCKIKEKKQNEVKI